MEKFFLKSLETVLLIERGKDKQKFLSLSTIYYLEPWVKRLKNLLNNSNEMLLIFLLIAWKNEGFNCCKKLTSTPWKTKINFALKKFNFNYPTCKSLDLYVSSSAGPDGENRRKD